MHDIASITDASELISYRYNARQTSQSKKIVRTRQVDSLSLLGLFHLTFLSKVLSTWVPCNCVDSQLIQGNSVHFAVSNYKFRCNYPVCEASVSET